MSTLLTKPVPPELAALGVDDSVTRSEAMLPSIEYCVGFLFSDAKTHVALIKKNKPEWQKGRYNGVGGKIEAGETPLEAQVREFEEETGVVTFEQDWELFMSLEAFNPRVSQSAVVHFFRGFAPEEFLRRARTTTDEEVRVARLNTLDFNSELGFPTMANLRWVIPMALGMDREPRVGAFLVKELA